MLQVRYTIRSVLYRIGQVEMAICAAILIGIVLMILAQVLLNAGLGDPITWEQEAGAYALVWMTFLGASIGLKYVRHVTIISFIGKQPSKLRSLVRVFTFGIMLWTLYILVCELQLIMVIEARSTTVALPIDLPRSYFFSVPLLLSSLLMILTLILFLFEATLGIFGDECPGLLAPIMGQTQ